MMMIMTMTTNKIIYNDLDHTVPLALYSVNLELRIDYTPIF